MGWSTAFEALMADSLVVTSFSAFSTDGYLVPSYSTAGTTYQARVVLKNVAVKDFTGTEVISRAHGWIASTSTFAAHDQFKVNGSTLGPLLSVESYPDQDGTHHQKLFWG